MSKNSQERKLWNKNYILLLQGQMVSTFGDAIYSIALSLFTLNLTGSSTLVGAIMGMVVVPKILLGPIAGAFIDRFNKKKIMVIADLLRGITILLIAFLGYTGDLKVWMLVVSAFATGICTTFFNPTMETIMPLVSGEDNLIKANSIFDMMVSGVDVFGQMLGGALFSFLYGPFVFMMNGLSFVFSAASEMFISLPKSEKKVNNKKIWSDIKDGMEYIFKDKGLSYLILMSFLLNFLFGIIRVLIIPWFVNTEGFGEAKYGLFSGACSIGMFAGMLFLSVISIKHEKKYFAFFTSVIAFIGLIDAASLINRVWIVIGCFVLAFSFQVIFNTLLCTTLIINTNEELRGKVTATRITLCMAASPLGNLLGGVLGDCVSPNIAITLCASVSLVFALLFLPNKEIRLYFSRENN